MLFESKSINSPNREEEFHEQRKGCEPSQNHLFLEQKPDVP